MLIKTSPSQKVNNAHKDWNWYPDVYVYIKYINCEVWKKLFDIQNVARVFKCTHGKITDLQ